MSERDEVIARLTFCRDNKVQPMWSDFERAIRLLRAPAEASELRAIAAWIRTPGNVWHEDAIDQCARVLENRARDLERPAPPGAPAEEGAKR